MKFNFQLSFGIGLLFLIFAQTTQAQILQTRSEIMETYGSPFCSGTSENDESYLFYKIPVTTENSGTYHQRKVFLFKNQITGRKYALNGRSLNRLPKLIIISCHLTVTLYRQGNGNGKIMEKELYISWKRKKAFVK